MEDEIGSRFDVLYSNGLGYGYWKDAKDNTNVKSIVHDHENNPYKHKKEFENEKDVDEFLRKKRRRKYERRLL
jgi:hypothetical protein